MLAIASQAKLIVQGGRAARELGDADRVVVFVHGFLASGAVFDPMRDRIARVVSAPSVEFTYPPLGTVESIAARLTKFVARKVPRGTRVSLVGHSLGGIVARWYVQELGGQERVDRLVLLATPHAGTRGARFSPGRLGAALRPESALVRRLAERRNVARDIPHVAIVAGADMMVTPPSSAAAIDGADVIWFPSLGHNALLFDRHVHDAVANALR